MDVNELRSVMTVFCFVVFLAILAWTYSKKNRQGFEEAAAVPFLDDDAAETRTGDSRE